MKSWAILTVMLMIVLSSASIYAKGQRNYFSNNGTTTSQGYNAEQTQSDGCR